MASVPEEDDGEPKVCASEWGKCECKGVISYGADKGDGTLNMAKGWTKKNADNSGVTVCSNTVFGDPLPGTVKKCFCQNSFKEEKVVVPENKGELEYVPFNFEAENPDGRYQLKEKYHGSVKKGVDNVFTFSSWGYVSY